MHVENILNAKGRFVVTAPPEARIATVLAILKKHSIGAVAICDGSGRLLGVLSERDIVLGLAEHGPDALGLTAAELMQSPARSCAPQDDVSHVMRAMTRWHVRHLPVLDQGRLCGLVSIGDVVKHRLDEVSLEVNVLRDAYIMAQVGCAPAA
jgi:CBS domain-containing protein